MTAHAPQPTLTLAGTNRRCWVMGWTPPGASTSLFAITVGPGPCITVPHLSQPSFRGTLQAADYAFEGVTVDRRHDPSPGCPFCRWAMPKRPILRKAARDFFT